MELDPQVKRKPKRNTDAKAAVAAAAQATAQENDEEEASSTTKTQNVQLHMMGFAKDVVLKQRRRMRWRKPTCLGKEEQTSILLCAVGGAVAGSPPPAVDAGREHAGAGASRACVQGGGRDAFHIYYGQGFKVIKNTWGSKSYLLMQNMSKMATKTKYCTGKIKSFVIPIANYSVHTTASPVSFFEILGVLENFKGITSVQECVLQAYANGNIHLLIQTDKQKISQFSAHLMGSTDQHRGCNFAAYVPSKEDTPLQ